MNDNLFIY